MNTRLFKWSILLSASLIFTGAVSMQDPSSQESLRQKAQQCVRDGNYKDAFDSFEKLVLSANDDPTQAGSDLAQAIQCLQNLGRTHETDALRDKALDVHSRNPLFLRSAALTFLNGEHYGEVIAGDFYRGGYKGSGQQVSSMERDRIRALQLLNKALAGYALEINGHERYAYYLEFASALRWDREGGREWMLQIASDLSTLPDYEEYYYRYYSEQVSAPVDGEGNPVYYTIPEKFETAANDGERWRWLLDQAIKAAPEREADVLMQWADFLHSQFGVQTLSDFHRYLSGSDDDDTRKNTYALHTLDENETLARLATGVKRFTLPDEFNFIAIFRKIAEGPRSGAGESAWNRLAGIFENRRQYEKAAGCWLESIERYRDNGYKKQKYDQIVNNWGQFEPADHQPAGQGAVVDYRFRNGTNVRFEAYEIDTRQILDDIKSYLNADPGKLDWNRINLGSIGYDLVQKNEKKYVRERVAEWALGLSPRKHHFDRRINVTTPLQKAGAYLLTAQMEKGNTSKVILWVHDTVIVKKQLDEGTWFYVADAMTGKPIAKANLEFFGYRQERVQNKLKSLLRSYNVLTSHFAEFTDDSGQVLLKPDAMEPNHNWLITATTSEGRLAYLGFTNVWHSPYQDYNYDQVKTLFITDRPVYRPGQEVKFKAWMRRTLYSLEESSLYANQSFMVWIENPKGEKVLEKSFTTDEFGGFDSMITLPDEAALGIYRIWTNYGQGTFRVEEYKKPEFEVSVEAPEKPIQLGDTIRAKIKANYYFGSPVTKATVKYKVLRSEQTSQWYPLGPWDWFYGPGYGWFCYDYTWYPGWYEWGCRRPHYSWMPWSPTPPEVVMENEVEIDESGEAEVVIDTSFARELFGDRDHSFEIVAEVRDASRRTIVGRGKVLAARKPFSVYTWVDRGYYHVGDEIEAGFSASTLDRKPVQGSGEVRLLKISYDQGKPKETAVQRWKVDTGKQGQAALKIKASQAGQYRLSFTLTDSAGNTMEGGYIFCIRGQGFGGSEFRFNDLELIADQREYQPGETANLMINTNRADSTVMLFVRPVNGTYRKPRTLTMTGKSRLAEIEVIKSDMPNFFVEAVTISQGKVHSELLEILVPPEKKVLDLEVMPSATEYKPGEPASIRLLLKDLQGKPFKGSCALTLYDKSIEYISGGSNVPEIRSFFWKWQRQHHPNQETSLDRGFGYRTLFTQPAMENLGVFGFLVADDELDAVGYATGMGMQPREGGGPGGARMKSMEMAMPSAAMGDGREMKSEVADSFSDSNEAEASPMPAPEEELAQPTVRTQFADTAFWAASITTDEDGFAEVHFTMPENLTGWKIRTWAMGHGTRVGQAEAEVVTRKNLLLRMQAPRFFVERDEVVLSANVHNYLGNDKAIKAVLELDGDTMEIMGDAEQRIQVAAGSELRVDWRVKVLREGEAVVRMKALSDEESDAMEMRFPVFVHGMARTESFSGAMKTSDNTARITFHVPEERRVNESCLEIRYSPTLAGAMVDALPYLADYPYGCTEQTLNRFLPAVITQKILLDMGLSLEAIRDKRVNLNAQEIGDAAARAQQWQHWKRNPVFDAELLVDMVKTGVKRLTSMQLSDGGWGWFSGWGEQSYPHTTAVVVHGLQMARENDVALVPGMLEKGITWLEQYQSQQVRMLENAPEKKHPWKSRADDLDAYVYMVLSDEGRFNATMRTFLYRDRNDLSLYSKAMFGLALHKEKQADKLAMIVQNIEQFLVTDDENQTAWLNLPGESWWYWYGSEYEALAYYLKLLARIAPQSPQASGVAKYLINNRKHATYWNSTRDTALCIEALADYMRASNEDKPEMTLEIFIDGRKHKEVTLDKENLFSFDSSLVLIGDAIESGDHVIEFKKKGNGPLYFNAYLTCFTLEEFIYSAGLEIKVARKYYRLEPVDKAVDTAGSHGQALKKKVEKYDRIPIESGTILKSNDLVEIELEIESKNDYEYILFEDMKAAGFEPMEVQSGYLPGGLSAYMELRDERVCFFARTLPHGRHSLSYRMRAEIPGRFSALPTRAYGMYAPELKANSDEIKIGIED
ncbi:MAG: MG2 domain-containing protein [Planctomycetota bacterium]